MNPITSIEQLSTDLSSAQAQQHSKIMRSIRISAQDLESYATWCPEGYTRNCLARTKGFELILLCWDIGAKAPIHDHGGEDCWIYQIQGAIEEIRFEKNGDVLHETNRTVLIPGRLTYMNDRMGYHAIENNSNHRAMTLHIYAAPIDNCNVFNDNTDCFEFKELFYDTSQEKEAVLIAS